jgi:RNA polymerase sigma-70 factor (family 1)
LSSNPSYNEKALLQQVAQGDERSFRELYDHYYNRIYSIAYKLTKTESVAEDVVQEIFIKLWVHKETLSGVDNFNAYLNTLIRNHVFNCMRRLATEEVFLHKMIDEGSVVSDDVHDALVYKELRKRLSDVISRLSPQQKRAYHLSRIEGLKHEEIASQMNISRETVKKHIGEALRLIKSQLREDELPLLFIGVLLFGSSI